MIRPSHACLLLLLPMSAWDRSAHAQDLGANQRLAQSLFDQARQLMDEQKYDDACPKFAESQRLDPGGGTLLNLAVCHEKQGKTATAWSEYHAALSQAIADGREERRTLAQTRIAALEPSLSRVVISVPAQANIPGLEVALDGAVFRPPSWGVPTPIDPGTHSVEASAPSRMPWRTTIHSAEPGQTLTVDIPPLQPFASQPTHPCLPNQRWDGMRCSSVLPQQPAPTHYTTNSYLWNTVSYSVGTVALTVSAITGTLALVASHSADSSCNKDRNYCSDDSGRDKVSQAHSYALASTISLGIGVAGIVVGAVLPPVKKTQQIDVGLRPSPAGAQLTLKATLPLAW